MTFSLKDVRLDGCVFGRPDKRDYRTEFEARKVPDKVDLRSYCTAVENQGHIGSCTANAAVGALEYLFRRRDGLAADLSRLFVYYNTRRMKGTIPMDTGAQISEAMASVLAFGACREEMWPYDPALFDQEPPKEAYDDARMYEAIAYARVEGVTGTIHAVAQGFPVVFGTCLPGRCYEEAARSGVMPQLTDKERQSRSYSGHAMLIVGYNKKERMFIVRNSWGEGWGDRGYCRIPFDSLDSCSPPEGFWMVSELEKQGGFRLIRPGKELSSAAEPASQVPAMETGGMSSTASRMRDEIRSSLEVEMGASSIKADSRRAGNPSEKTLKGAHGLKQNGGLTICVACAGVGICSQCHGRGSGCRNCLNSGFCTDCDGTGVR